MKTRRAHVFRLTDNEQAMLDLYRESGLPKGEFCRLLGYSKDSGMLSKIIAKSRDWELWQQELQRLQEPPAAQPRLTIARNTRQRVIG